MKKLLIAIAVICGVGFAFAATPSKKEKECSFCSYIECGLQYIEIMPNGWWVPKVCHNYVAIGSQRCSMHGGSTCTGFPD